MENDTPTPLLIVGGPGSGKSTILAKWYIFYVMRHIVNVERFAGLSIRSFSLMNFFTEILAVLII